ncbi:hypothetical protein [Nocardia asteroides]|uniref:hypothetical protein n=1 Tax=Nocardia asteroides TaxID=1824 RepID=UPI001E5341CE|nr:hypothetical protein [Nocardia asteroides]UGT61942.1 hypothetical protein LTT61_00885 [Nocardia asteroides]
MDSDDLEAELADAITRLGGLGPAPTRAEVQVLRERVGVLYSRLSRTVPDGPRLDRLHAALRDAEELLVHAAERADRAVTVAHIVAARRRAAPR